MFSQQSERFTSNIINTKHHWRISQVGYSVSPRGIIVKPITAVHNPETCVQYIHYDVSKFASYVKVKLDFAFVLRSSTHHVPNQCSSLFIVQPQMQCILAECSAMIIHLCVAVPPKSSALFYERGKTSISRIKYETQTYLWIHEWSLRSVKMFAHGILKIHSESKSIWTCWTLSPLQWHCTVIDSRKQFLFLTITCVISMPLPLMSFFYIIFPACGSVLRDESNEVCALCRS